MGHVDRLLNLLGNAQNALGNFSGITADLLFDDQNDTGSADRAAVGVFERDTA
jgi:hypothetical protein